MANNISQSLFLDYVKKYFKGVTVKVVEKLNGEQNAELTYLYKTMLKKEFSVTGKWETLETLSTRVSADFVAMDSSLPLKKRDSIRKASGDIAKSGMTLTLNEQQLTTLDTMVAAGVDNATIIAKLFEDTPRVITGIYELMEDCFLRGLSTGVGAIPDNEHVGSAIRLDYGYLAENRKNADIAWGSANATPLTDIEKILDEAEAKGVKLTQLYMDSATLKNFLNNTQVKALYGNYMNWLGQTSLIPTPTLNRINEALAADDRYGLTIHKVNRTILREKNGVRTAVKPWQAGAVVLTQSTEVGTLVYAKLAEDNHRVAGVEYNTVDDYILVSKYSKNEPALTEVTKSQARVVPVICNVEGIYTLDTNPLVVAPTTLDFTKAADATGKVVTVTTNDTFTATVPATDTWATVSISGNEVTVKVSSNSTSGSPERSTTLTITSGDKVATVTVNQAGA